MSAPPKRMIEFLKQQFVVQGCIVAIWCVFLVYEDAMHKTFEEVAQCAEPAPDLIGAVEVSGENSTHFWYHADSGLDEWIVRCGSGRRSLSATIPIAPASGDKRRRVAHTLQCRRDPSAVAWQSADSIVAVQKCFPDRDFGVVYVHYRED